MMLVDKRNEIPTMQGIIAGGTAEYGVARISAPCFAKGRTKKKLEKIFKKKNEFVINPITALLPHWYETGCEFVSGMDQGKEQIHSQGSLVTLRGRCPLIAGPGRV